MRLWTGGERLAALRTYDILDTAPEVAFDDVVEIARVLTDAPVALISFVDADRQWFKARRGTDIEGTPLETSFCAIAVETNADVLVIPDAEADPRVRHMPIVVGDPFVRAYAGVLLRSSEGAPLGTVCVLDVKPRPFSPEQVGSLQALARQVMAQMELRRAAQERAEAAAALRDFNLGYELAMSAARLGRWDHRPHQGARFYDARAREILRIGPDEDIALRNMLDHIRAEDRESVRLALESALSPDRIGPFRIEFRVSDPRTGALVWVSAIGRTTFEHGVCTRFFGVMEDITERRRAEEERSLLTGELNHRVKNILSLAQSVVDSSLRNAASLVAARGDVASRLQALGHAHELLLATSWEAAPVTELVAGVMRDLSLDSSRMEVQGPPVRLGARAALQLTLALHELATNAAKHGALSNDTGRVTLSWGLSDDPEEARRFHMEWRERGGPPVTRPKRSGFGTRVIERATEAAFGGPVTLDYAPEGVRWSVSAPLSGLRERAAADA